MSLRPRLALVAFVLAACAAVPLACNGDPTLVVCRDVPDGGCPIQENACSDPACVAVYACDHVSGTWSLDHTCPPHPPVDAGPDVAPPEASPRDVDVDVPGASGGPGCPDLEPPDCPLATAAACPTDCCGCEDLYVCQGGGWTAWGACVNGAITKNP